MGTNFYMRRKPRCECCGREYERIHIGKRSMGWKFTLQARYETDDWQRFKQDIATAHKIEDQYGKEYTPAEMIEIVEGWQDGRSMVQYHRRGQNDYWEDADGYVFAMGDFS